MGTLRVAKRPSCHLATAGIQEIHPAHLSPSTDCRIMNLSESHPQNHFPGMGSGWRSLLGRVQRGWGQAGLHFPSYHARLVSHPNWGPHWGRTALGLHAPEGGSCRGAPGQKSSHHHPSPVRVRARSPCSMVSWGIQCGGHWGGPTQLLEGCADNRCFFLPLLLLQSKAQVTCDQGWPFFFVQESLLGWMTFCP